MLNSVVLSEQMQDRFSLVFIFSEEHYVINFHLECYQMAAEMEFCFNFMSK